jgi:hypothetical protein
MNQFNKLKRVDILASEKGGVGKSAFAKALIDALRSTAVRVAAFDADAVASLLNVHGTRGDDGKLIENQSPIDGVGFYNIRSAERNLLLDSIADGDPLIIHDVAGGALSELTNIVDGGNGVGGLLDAFAEHGYRVTCVHIMSPTAAATQSVARYLDAFGDRADHLVVKNLFWGTEYPFWAGFVDGAGVSRGGKTRERFLAMAGIEISFPSLPSSTFAKLDESNLSPLMATKSTLLTITERSQVKRFRDDFWASVQPARHILGF